VQPSIIVALGATAGQAFLGSTFRLTRSRGEFLETPWTSQWMATYHPSALLRMPDETARAQAEAHFRADLTKVAKAFAAL
jgi:DNA polymerase